MLVLVLVLVLVLLLLPYGDNGDNNDVKADGNSNDNSGGIINENFIINLHANNVNNLSNNGDDVNNKNNVQQEGRGEGGEGGVFGTPVHLPCFPVYEMVGHQATVVILRVSMR